MPRRRWRYLRQRRARVRETSIMRIEIGASQRKCWTILPAGGDGKVSLNYVCDTREQAEELAKAHEDLHGVPAVVEPILLSVVHG